MGAIEPRPPPSLKLAVGLSGCGDNVLEISLAKRWGLPCVAADDQNVQLMLVYAEGRLQLIEPGSRQRSVWVDFSAPSLVRRQSGARSAGELLFRAVRMKIKKDYSILDLTAGFGTDSFVLAAMGNRVTALERCPAIFELLKDGLQRAGEGGGDSMRIASRIHLLYADAGVFLRNLGERHDYEVIYLDPMYPQRKRQAESRRQGRLLRELAGDDLDSSEVLSLALARAVEKVVVKRPLRAEILGGRPAYSVKGVAVRFDVYLCR